MAPDRSSPARGLDQRNAGWHHMDNADIFSMPDKWEYPWYAAWDLAFHVIALRLVDEDFGKRQLDLMLSAPYLHPNGQLPAYEWNFGDVNPPVHAWSTIYTYRLTVARGTADFDWLERSFQKLLLNFTWWVNRKDRNGSNLFEGGFLGLDNIGIFDRSSPLPGGGHLEQADGTAWMALFSQNLLDIAIELATQRPVYAEMAEKFVEHFLWIATAMLRGAGGTGMWDEEDGFFYDVLRGTRWHGDAAQGPLDGRPPAALRGDLVLRRVRRSSRRSRRGCSGSSRAGRSSATFIHDPLARGEHGRRMAAVLDETQLRRVLARMLDEGEFLSPHGIRSLSRWHLEHPYELEVEGQQFRIGYVPGRVGLGDVRGQLELARPGLDAGERADHPRAAAVPRLLRRRVHDRVPDGLGHPDEPVRGGRGDRAPAGRDLPARARTGAGRSTAAPRSSRRTRTGGTTSCSTSTSTATTAPASAPAIRPAGRARSRR